MEANDPLAQLNSAQRAAVEYGVKPGSAEPPGPLLIIAGAGSGKTNTLAHRVAHLIRGGADPRRILLLTFTRRAASEMTRRAQRILARVRRGGSARAEDVRWAGTFHGVANRLLRLHAEGVGLDPSFTVLDRSDSADLIDLVRHDLGLAKQTVRFPRKDTCFAIYSRTVNAQVPLERVLEETFPWCAAWHDELKGLFAAYVGAKQGRQVLDYDDLLLYWFHLMGEEALAVQVRQRFDHVLVDEYQDTNLIQAGIVRGLKPDGAGVTVVGDDAQAIYSFRGATVRNILDFPRQYDPPAQVITLEENYRSTQPILDAANAVMSLASERFTKDLFSRKRSEEKPRLVTTRDEVSQVQFVVERILHHREAGTALKHQAVLARAAHHTDALEVELARRDIPFVKFGGLRFLEAGHVKDMLGALRWAENPRDVVAALRVLQLLSGIGPATARQAIAAVEAAAFDLRRLVSFTPPAAAREDWPALCALLARLAGDVTPWPAQVGQVRSWYQPHLERLYESAAVRAGDLEQLEQIAAQFPTRERFLSEVVLDPPEGSGDEAGPPHLDEDYLILSTIHSAKGQEWDVVYVLNAADGCIPSDLSTGNVEQIEEERRLLYVAMTRAREFLYVVHPQRFFIRQQHRHGDRHLLTPVSRFLPAVVRERFTQMGHVERVVPDEPAGPAAARVDVGALLRGLWE